MAIPNYQWGQDAHSTDWAHKKVFVADLQNWGEKKERRNFSWKTENLIFSAWVSF